MGASAGVPIQHFCPPDRGQDMGSSCVTPHPASNLPEHVSPLTENEEEEERKSPFQDRVGEGGEVTGGKGGKSGREHISICDSILEGYVA